MKFQKRCFTLLEIFIVLTIISVVGALVGIRVSHALKKYRFEHSASRLKSQLLFCRDLSLNIQSDLCCVLKQTEKGLESSIVSSEGGDLFKGQSRLNETFDHVYLLESMNQEIQIEFFSSGAISLKQNLEVRSKDGESVVDVFATNQSYQ